MNQHPVPTMLLPAHDLATLEDEITELSAHINAATLRLLTRTHPFYFYDW